MLSNIILAIVSLVQSLLLFSFDSIFAIKNLFRSQKFEYDFYIYVTDLPGAICQNFNCDNYDLANIGEKRLNMHGLWPQRTDGSYPQSCTSDTYDPEKLSNQTLTRLDQHWVGLYNSTYWFRFHEYRKHGTCFQTLPNSFLQQKQRGQIDNQQEQYFNAVMELKEKFNLEQLVFEKPNTTVTELYTRISESYNITQFDLECETINDCQELLALYFCFDKNYEPVDCPQTFLKGHHVQKKCSEERGPLGITHKIKKSSD